MRNDYNMQNMDFNKMMKFLVFISFVAQWSLISMVLNLFTLGLIRLPLFVLMIVDALTMIVIKDKTVKRPSFILSKVWDFIDYLRSNNSGRNYDYSNGNSSVARFTSSVSDYFANTKNKINNLINNFKGEEDNRKKYDKERELNKFSTEIGKNVIIEYTSEDNKMKKKTFQYQDRAITYIRMLESKGYKNYTKYNLNPNESLTYIVFNKNNDIIDLENNKIQLKKEDKDYKYVINGWPKKKHHF